jgi:uncharacterized protein (TIGR03067 family)
MYTRVLFAAVAALGLTAFAPAPFPRPDRKDDIKKLAGTWTVTRYELAGAAMHIGIGLKVRIEGNKWSFLRVNAAGTLPSTSYTFALDPKKDPRLIDLTLLAVAGRPAGGNKLMGIYQFDRSDRKNKFQIVFNTFGINVRPAGFDGADRRAYLMILQRDAK